MALNDTWNIRSRATACHATDRPFDEGETLFVAIFKNEGEDGYERRDYCADAWKKLALANSDSTPTPYSSWQTDFEPTAPPNEKPEIVEKESAEGLLHRLIEEDDAGSENARYILAVMLERKKILKQVDVKDGEEMRLLFYENVRNGDALIIRDPLLKLSEVDAIRDEVARWLGGDKEKAPPAETADADSEPDQDRDHS